MTVLWHFSVVVDPEPNVGRCTYLECGVLESFCGDQCYSGPKVIYNHQCLIYTYLENVRHNLVWWLLWTSTSWLRGFLNYFWIILWHILFVTISLLSIQTCCEIILWWVVLMEPVFRGHFIFQGLSLHCRSPFIAGSLACGSLDPCSY